MKAEVRLDSAVFQLTPTRTRCDLVIMANGKTEKIAAGLLKPFLAHLKTAQDQIAKGGYSITLEPDPRRNAVWFTKGTMERFVRFVSTPEVLERVSTIESEILQIEEAIFIQGNENLGLSVVEDHQRRPTNSIEGSWIDSKSTVDADAEKAIVLYKPESHLTPPDSNQCTKQEESSKVKLLRVLESRKTVLQKEQGMAFARAAAAGFDMDHIAHLIAFAECFGASRLMEACLQFMELWKGKHENGQWLEVEAADEMYSRSEFYSLNASGIILSEDNINQKECNKAWQASELGTENNTKADESHPADSQGPLGRHEYFQERFQHSTLPQWPMYPPGPPFFQMYPLLGIPYYQSYPGSGPYFQSPYAPMDDPRSNNPQRTGLKRHSMDSTNSNFDSEPSDMGVYSTKSQDGADQKLPEFEKEDSRACESRRRHDHSRRNNSGVVILRKVNHITSKRQGTSESESPSTSDSETKEETEDLHSKATEGKHKNSSRSLKKKVGRTKSVEVSNTYGKDEVVYGQDADSGNWQEFQSFLLRAEENTSTIPGNIFSGEKRPPVKRGETSEADATLLSKRDSGFAQEPRMAGFDFVNGKASRIKQGASNDVLLVSCEGRGLKDNQLGSQFKEIEGVGGGYQKAVRDDFIIYGREKQMGHRSSDPLPEHDYEHAGNMEKSSPYIVTDESFMVPFRSAAHNILGTDIRTAIDMDSKFPSALQRTENFSNRAKNQPSYEPDVLMLMPERGMGNGSVGYDQARDYDIQIPVEDTAMPESRNQEDDPTSTKEGSKKSNKEKKSKVSQDGLEKRKKDSVMRKETSSKLNPLAEAQKRAEKMRAFKADLRKVKKEKEEEDIKRLEALKRERQKRIAARSSSNTAQSPITLKQNRAQLPSKLSPSSYKGSKFSDSEPRSSYLQTLPTRTTSIGSGDIQSITKLSRLNGGTNGLDRSVSSLPELKKEYNGLMSEKKAASIRSKRLSDPKESTIHRASSLKPVRGNQVPTKKIVDEPQTKISAIMLLDKTKSATLPVLRIKTLIASSDVVHNSGSKETLEKGAGSKISQISESMQHKKSNGKPPKFSNIDDNPVVEKTVVMLENEKVPASKETIDMKDRSQRDDRSVKTRLESEFVTNDVHTLKNLISQDHTLETLHLKHHAPSLSYNPSARPARRSWLHDERPNHC